MKNYRNIKLKMKCKTCKSMKNHNKTSNLYKKLIPKQSKYLKLNRSCKYLYKNSLLSKTPKKLNNLLNTRKILNSEI